MMMMMTTRLVSFTTYNDHNILLINSCNTFFLSANHDPTLTIDV